MALDGPKPQLPPIGVRALRSGPALTVILALVIAASAASQYAVPAPTLFLLITVTYSAALGGWKAGLASGLISLLYLFWLLTNTGQAAQYQPLNRTLLTIGGVALPLAIVAGWVLHRTLQRERGRELDRATSGAYHAGEAARDRRFRTLVEQVRDYAIVMIDPNGHFATWNEGVRRLLGYEEAEFLGQHGSMLFTPEDRERGEPDRELRVAAEEGRASDDRWLVRKDGSRFWATGITGRVTDEAGRLVGFSKVLQDLTHEREAQDRLRDSEDRLRVALQAARMGIWRWHLPTNTQRVDGSMARLLGLGDGQVVESYAQFREHVHPADRERVDAAFARTARTGGNMQIEFRVVWPDGSVRWLSDHGQVVHDQAGTPEYLTGAAVDVTERKTAEERLVEAQRMDAVGHLAGGVAHEINNMMTVVLGFSALLLDQLRDHPLAGDLRQIHRAADHASNITKQLLAFSRRQLLRPEVLDLNQVVGGLEPMLRRVLGEDKVIATELAAALAPVRADPGQMEQVLLNLTLNARDAMPAGGTFTVRTRTVVVPHREVSGAAEGELLPGRYVELAVSDTGSGMDAATRAHLFEPFFTTKPLGQGTGLGLATVFGIVQQSGGTIRVQTVPGQGTTFTVYLPEASDLTISPHVRAPRGVERGTETVLVVEDEAPVRDLTCRFLAAQGYQCVEATNGAEALELVRQRGTDISAVVTDVVMPGMGGRVLADQLAAVRPSLPVLFMSAYTGDEVISRGLMAPDAPFLQKPFTLEVLAQKVRELLNGGASPTASAGPDGIPQ